jgi:hypothetical protein
MSILHQTLDQAMKDRAPALHQQLKASGKLGPYLRQLAAEINSQVVTTVQEMRMAQHWDRLPPLELAARLKAAESSAMEVALGEALQFPLDETSSPSLAPTIASPMPT